MMKSLRHLLLWVVLSSPALLRAGEPEDPNVFGSKEAGTTGLIGIIYDLKQNQKRQPSGVVPDIYGGIIHEFLDKDWDESVLNRYFRAAQPLYTTQIFIPMMNAGAAPKAFGMEKIIKPSAWVVHYKGQVSPPEDGTYRFMAYSDDMIAVGINGHTVCQGSRRDIPLDDVWTRPDRKDGPSAANGALVFGDWLDLKKNVPVDLDVIIGERPGGGFCAFLLYEKQGVDYPKQNGQTLYPIFQTAPYNTPDPLKGDGPLFLRESKYWKGYQ